MKECKNNDLLGKWKTEKFSVGQFFGFWQISLNDSLKIPGTCLSDEFNLNVLNDSLFTYRNKPGKTVFGKYERKNDTLKLRKGNEKFAWIDFKIDSVNFNHIYLCRDKPSLIYFIEKDTIAFYTGRKIKITLLKEKTN